MDNVRIEIEGEKGIIHSNILPKSAIEHTQRIFGDKVRNIIPVDENGKDIQTSYFSSPKKSAPQENEERKNLAFEAMKKRAKELKIKGWQRMSEESLLKAIQEHN